MEKEIIEQNEKLRELVLRINKSIAIAQDAKEKISDVLRASNLRSTITMLESDIALRRVLERCR